MKTATIISSLIFLSIFSFSSEKEIEKSKFEEKKSVKVSELENSNLDCSWSGLSSTTSKRGVSCGSSTSLKVYYTNPYSYKVRVAFYLRDQYGNTKGTPYVIHVAAGRKGSTHKCHSDGTYSVLVARYDERCRFPDYY